MVETDCEHGESAPSSPSLGLPEFLVLIGLTWRQFRTLDAVSKAILERIQADRQSEIDLAIALTRCVGPADALALYTQWATQRTTSILQDGARLASLLFQDRAPPSPEPESEA